MTQKKEEQLLCKVLAEVLQGRQEIEIQGEDDQTINQMLHIADKHQVLSLLYPLVQGNSIQEEQKQWIVRKSRQIVQQSYRLLFLTKYLTEQLQREGIPVIVLKGPAVSVYYPEPELRKSGDVDLLIESYKKHKRKIDSIMNKVGFRKTQEQWSDHHIVFASPEGIDVELHTMLSKTTDNSHIDAYLKWKKEDFFQRKKEKKILGISLPVLTDGCQAFYLVVHMLQHFMTAGFGLKLLCDWVVFWNREVCREEQQVFVEAVRECGIMEFVRMITELCVQYLGLNKERVSFLLKDEENRDSSLDRLLQEIFEAEEFGNSSSDRMVVVQGNGILAYAREFHHQMKITYPRSSKCVLLWPVLWITLFVGFLYRNHTRRNISLRQIIQRTKTRSAWIKELGLMPEAKKGNRGEKK